MTHSLQMQIAEIERELKMRRNLYRRLVATRAMTQSMADMKIAIMESVLATLRAMKAMQEAPHDNA
jgi:hypothetical protein